MSRSSSTNSRLVQGLSNFFITWGATPRELTQGVDLPPTIGLPIYATIFTSLFMHGGWLHLGGNMLFLWVFGDNVENAMGSVKYLLFYLICGIGAAGAQIITDVNSLTPLIGASGAIAGVMGAYLVMFPGATVRTLVFVFIFATVIYLPAVLVIGLWFVLQLFQGIASVGMDAGTAFWAHVGGLIVGVQSSPSPSVAATTASPRQPRSGGTERGGERANRRNGAAAPSHRLFAPLARSPFRPFVPPWYHARVRDKRRAASRVSRGVAMAFRVGVTRDFLKADGSLGFGDIGLALLDAEPGVEWEFLAEDTTELRAEQVRDYDAVIVLTPIVSHDTLARAERLAVVARFGVGYDTVDVAACTEAGVILVITPDGVRRPVAQATLAFMLALSTRIWSRRTASPATAAGTTASTTWAWGSPGARSA